MTDLDQIINDVCIKQDNILRTSKKNCYLCKREITLHELRIANPSMDKRLFGSFLNIIKLLKDDNI